jgi:2-polyprenyl-3-methyl-5-hydroxy-6-metoxy-1,4-benzoquinol methylase
MTLLPGGALFQSTCRSGLHVVRPIKPDSLRVDDDGFDFGQARAPSYFAYGRLRALINLTTSRRLLKGRQARVLEIAAGDAALSACLAADGHAVTANDLLADSLQGAVGRFKTDISLAPGNLFDLDPGQLGTFDLIVACEIIEHVAHSDLFLRHLKTLLSPGGLLYITTPNGRYFRNKLPTYSQVESFVMLEAKQFKADADGHLFLITPDEMRELARSCGLRVQELAVWATPFITGEAGFRYLAPLLTTRLCYALESCAQRLSERRLSRVGNSLSVVLAAT